MLHLCIISVLISIVALTHYVNTLNKRLTKLERADIFAALQHSIDDNLKHCENLLLNGNLTESRLWLAKADGVANAIKYLPKNLNK